ncbi:hypothetical protein O163_12105 [Caldanaerobacter subterraneus subsp. yonseiensis KB-1]|uniref:Uncharacterized protein n=1 Tax=Caldanaerobacter subterraneus subsp. yonseiensis KB-1 TaxID=1388761 RepID=U5CQB7_CALSX|nr:hypothetical protein O163_12105 [Caldanaerobacter subterraneus subsp. yonseiensis KB-1]
MTYFEIAMMQDLKPTKFNLFTMKKCNAITCIHNCNGFCCAHSQNSKCDFEEEIKVPEQ